MNENESGPIPARYCPIFESLLYSSLWDEPYHVRLTFIAFLALKGMDDIVRYTPYAIAKRSNMTEKEVLDAIKILSAPDKRRLEPQLYEGRRIKQVDGGWLVLNGSHYRKMVTRINVLASKAKWARENRKKGKKGMKISGSTFVGEIAELNGHPIRDLDGELKDVKMAKAGFDPLV